MDMTLIYSDLIAKAQNYLKEIVPTATSISFEEFGKSLAFDNPPNAIIVVLSYEDSSASPTATIATLFSKKMKAMYMDESGELLAVKNKLG